MLCSKQILIFVNQVLTLYLSLYVFNPVRKINSGIFSKTLNARVVYSPIQDLIVFFLNDMPEADEVSEKPIVVSSEIGEVRHKQHLFETSEVDRSKRRTIPHSMLSHFLSFGMSICSLFSHLLKFFISVIPPTEAQ